MRVATLCVVLLVLCGPAVGAQQLTTGCVSALGKYYLEAEHGMPNGQAAQAVDLACKGQGINPVAVAAPVDMTSAEMAALEIAAALNRYGCYLQPGQLTDWNGQQVPIVRVVSWYITWGGVQVPPDGTVMFNVCVTPAPGGEAWLVIKPVHEEGP